MEALPRRFDPSLALGIKGKGGFGEFRAWGGMSSGRVRERVGDDKGVVGREREKSGLNDVGPKPTKQFQPVRPVAPTGQTSLAQTDRTT